MNDEMDMDILDCLDFMLEHSGTPQMFDFDPNGSGRYRQGSGDNPYQRACSIQALDARLRREGFSEKERATAHGCDSVTKYRALMSSTSTAIKAETARQCFKLKNEGYSNREISIRVFGTPTKDTTVGNMLKPYYLDKANTNERVKDVLRDAVAKNKYVDVGSGTEHYIDVSTENQPVHGITNDKLKKCVNQLVQEEGYVVQNIDIQQVMTDHKTTVKVLCPPGTTKQEVVDNRADIATVTDYFIDNGMTRCAIYSPSSLDPSRVGINYAEDGGKAADGTMYIRKGVEDLSLGAANYAQVRIEVGGTHYLKGMAMYADDDMFPSKDIDILFNTNKSKDVPMMGEGDESVLKELKSDPDNPFGATIKRQIYYDDPNGEFVKVPDRNGWKYIKDDGTHADEPHLSLGKANIVNEEGDWGEWSKTIASQMLSKQPKSIIKPQLDLTYKEKEDEFNEIMSIAQPEVRKKLLMDFADSCDSDAVDLKAVGFPGQKTHVILPIPNMPENEIHAPGYENGTHVILIRYPHAGTFEIPELIVNNNRTEAIDILGKTPLDAVGISSKVAEKLSGADFDGDTVQVIPSDKIHFDVKPQLDGLKDFDPNTKYKKYEGMPVMTDEQKAFQMGSVSNLITDMTLQGAPKEHVERAVRHSMVVIDAKKHKLDWQASEREENIKELKTIYQGGPNNGAATLISKAGGMAMVYPREDYKDIPVFDSKGNPVMTIDKRGNTIQKTKRYYIDPETGKKLHTEKRSTYTEYKAYEYDENGNQVRIDIGNGKTKPHLITLYARMRDPETRERFEEPVFYDSKGKKYTGPIDKIKSKEVERKVEISKMQDELERTGDAHNLSSGNPKEELYADYANKVFNLGNRARLETLTIESSKTNPQAKKIYKEVLENLEQKLRKAQMNAPRERQAQIYANETIRQMKIKYPDLYADKDALKKKKGQALAGAREKFGAKKDQITLTDKEWEAIMAGAVPKTTLNSILDNCDLDALKKMALPRDTSISDSKKARIQSLENTGWTIKQIAERTGLSESTVTKVLKEQRGGTD